MNSTALPRETLELWDHNFEGLAGHLGLFSGLRVGDRLSRPSQAYFRYPAQTASAIAWLASESAGGREVYYCANLLDHPRRIKANSAKVRCLWVDGDGALVPAQLPQPTATVESSPGRHHYYWRLTEAIEPGRAEELNHRLAYTLGADKSGWDLTQLLRPPGFPNRKYADAPIVRLLQPC